MARKPKNKDIENIQESSVETTYPIPTTQQEWDNKKLNKPRDNGWGTITDNPREVCEISDSHFESETSLKLARIICESINNYKSKSLSS